MTDEVQIRWERFPLLAAHPAMRDWLQLQANLGLAPNTVEAYGRALNDYQAFCAGRPVQAEAATREHISAYLRQLATRPHQFGANVRRLDSGAGLANATLQQRLTAVRLYYDYLVEEGVRSTNPVGRGRYTQARAFAGARERGLLPRYSRLPWIPTDEQWLRIVDAARAEPLRNRMMFALAYDAA